MVSIKRGTASKQVKMPDERLEEAHRLSPEVPWAAPAQERHSRLKVLLGATHGGGKWRAYLFSAGAVGLVGLMAKLLEFFLPLPNLPMVFLIAVLYSAVTWGLGPSIFTSLLSVLVYNFFFMPPVYAFAVAGLQDLLTLVVFLIVAVLTSDLMARVREQAETAKRREAQTAALYALTREIADAGGVDDVLRVVVSKIAQIFRARAVLWLPDSGQLVLQAGYPPGTQVSEVERAIATWAWRHNQPAGRGTDTFPGAEWFFMPLSTANGTVGVLGLQFEAPGAGLTSDRRRLLEALADQAAVAIERTRLIQAMEQAKLAKETERLQAALLSSISHDLRTPLTSIIGAVTSLLTDRGTYDEATRRDLLWTIQEEAERLNRFVGNLLDVTRLESGALRLHREWVEIEEVIGVASARLARSLSQHRLTVDIQPGLPMLRLDFVLIEQVLVNLLDNAAKYSPPGTTIRLSARREGDSVVVEVADEGIGIPPADLERIFDKFYRVPGSDRQGAGLGLGLFICRGIVEAHGGRISARSPAAGGKGTVFTVTFPLEKEQEPSPASEQE